MKPLRALLALAVAVPSFAGTGHPSGFTETRYGAAFTLGTAMSVVTARGPTSSQVPAGFFMWNGGVLEAAAER